MAITWINQYILLLKELMLPFTSQILSPLLQSLSHTSASIRTASILTNANLYRLVYECPSSLLCGNDKARLHLEISRYLSVEQMKCIYFDLRSLMHVVKHVIGNEESRVCGMDWFCMLYSKTYQVLVSYS